MSKPTTIPTAAAFGQFRSQCARLGIKPAELDTAVASKVNGRTWKQIGDQLIQWLKDRPREP